MYKRAYIVKRGRGTGYKEIAEYLDLQTYVKTFLGIPTPVLYTEKYKVFNARTPNVSLRCVATDIFKKKTTVTWYHNNRRLTHHKEQFFSNRTVSSILEIHNASDRDVGVYWCYVMIFADLEKSSTRLIQEKEGKNQYLMKGHRDWVTLRGKQSIVTSITYKQKIEQSNIKGKRLSVSQ